MNKYIEKDINILLKKIIFKINEYKLDVVDVCDKLYIKIDDFIDLISNPQNNISLYLDILSNLEKMNRGEL